MIFINLVDKEKIRLIKFDDIVNNKLDSLNELLRINKNQLPELPVLNAKKSTRNHIVKVENKSFSTLVESVLPRYIYMKLKFVVSRLPFLKRYAKKLMSNNIRQSHRVKKMSEADKKHFKVRFEKGVKYIQIEFGLNFD